MVASAEIVGYIIVEKLLEKLKSLKDSMENPKQFGKLEYWPLFLKEKEYNDIQLYVTKEYGVFKVFKESVYNRVKNSISLAEPSLQEAVSAPTEANYSKILRNYAKELHSLLLKKESLGESEERNHFVHLNRVLDSSELEKTFTFET